MAGDGEVLIARQLTQLLADRGRSEQLEDAYCRLREHLPPTAALDHAMAELLPSREHQAVAALIRGDGEGAHRRGDVPPVHHSLVNGLEELFDQRQSSLRQERREHLDVADLASDLAADVELAVGYGEGSDEAGRWLQRFHSMVLERASASPTPTGRRLRVDQARNALLTAESDCQARTDGEADDLVTWCVALRDSLPSGGGDLGDDGADQSTEDRPDDELDDLIGTASTLSESTPPPLLSLEVLRSSLSQLGDEDHFTALIEEANGHDDHHDPIDDCTLEAMDRLLDDDVLESGDAPPAHVSGRVRNELWTHMLWGYRVGRYLLTTQRRGPSSFGSSSASYDASDLVSHVCQSYQRQDLADLMASSDLGAALHYHPVSPTLRRACGEDKTQARAWVTLMEDVGFLTALGAEDLTERTPAPHRRDTVSGDTRFGPRAPGTATRRRVGSDA